MRFFTAEWATGALDDHAFETAAERYAHYVEELQPPADVRLLAATDLHDGLVESVREEAASQLAVRLTTGDLQRGYRTTTIVYFEAIVSAAAIAFLEGTARTGGVEILQHEIDRDDGTWLHRILFANFEEVAIAFTGVAVAETPRTARHEGGSRRCNPGGSP